MGKNDQKYHQQHHVNEDRRVKEKNIKGYKDKKPLKIIIYQSTC